MKHVLLIVAVVATCGCASHRLQVSEGNAVSRDEILDAVRNVHVGMSADGMLWHLVPVASTSPCFRSLTGRTVRYYFGLGKNSQIWVEVDNPDDLAALGPGQPNGKVSAIGTIEAKEKWTFKSEDSNELKWESMTAALSQQSAAH